MVLVLALWRCQITLVLASSGRLAGGGGGCLADLGPPGTGCRAASTSSARSWRGSPGSSPLPLAPGAADGGGLASFAPGPSWKGLDARQSAADPTVGLLSPGRRGRSGREGGRRGGRHAGSRIGLGRTALLLDQMLGASETRFAPFEMHEQDPRRQTCPSCSAGWKARQTLKD